MTYEPHPFPERTLWRVGAPIVAAVLALTSFVLMSAVEPPARTVALIVVLVAQVALMTGRGLYLRRSARAADQALRWHQFLFAWSVYGSTAYLFSGDDSPLSAATHIGSGLSFALIFVVVLGLKRQSRVR